MTQSQKTLCFLVLNCKSGNELSKLPACILLVSSSEAAGERDFCCSSTPARHHGRRRRRREGGGRSSWHQTCYLKKRKRKDVMCEHVFIHNLWRNFWLLTSNHHFNQSIMCVDELKRRVLTSFCFQTDDNWSFKMCQQPEASCCVRGDFNCIYKDLSYKHAAQRAAQIKATQTEALLCLIIWLL